jgi:hypothetical protein
MAKSEYTELVNPSKVRIWHKKSGKYQDVFPVDANEILSAENSEYTNEEPKNSKAKSLVENDGVGGVPITSNQEDEGEGHENTVEEDSETEEVDLDSMSKAQLVEFAEANDIQITKSAAKDKIKEEITEALEGGEE